MSVSLKVLKSPLDVYSDDVMHFDSGCSIDHAFRQLSASYTGPCDHVICVVNGDEVSPDKWSDHMLFDGDTIIVCHHVHAVNLATIAINILISVALSVVASMLTSVPSADKSGDIPEASPTYSIDAQGNKARLGKVIPVRYGRFRIYPDFASTPYREYIGGDQYLYQLFAIGQGEYDYSDLKIGDTPIANFEEIEYEFYSPGQKITLFRDAVNVSPDVTNSTLFAPNEPEYTGDVGPFIANDVDTVAEEIAIDILIPKGLYFSNNDGGLDARSVRVFFEYRDVDNADQGVGTWKVFEDKTYTAATVEPIRRTIRKTITTTTGRVQVRGRRINSSTDDFKESDEVRWVGLKAYLDSSQTYNHSTWAVKAKATDNLSSQNERLFNLIAYRKLPIWDGEEWLPAATTRNIAWALCDAVKAEYGGNYLDKNLDLDGIKELADEWEARGDYFDGQFDTKTTLWTALKKMCMVGRAEPIQYGEQFSIVRDGDYANDTYMFNGRNMTKGSLAISYLTVDEFADDSVEIEYTDPNTWKQDFITAAVPGSPANQPKKVKLDGCTSRLQAHREAMFMAAKQEYRNIVGDFGTELDGRNIGYLSKLIVVQDISRWGKGGEVLAVDGNTLTLSEPVTFDVSGDHFIYLRDDSGRTYEPQQCTFVANNKVTVLGTLPAYVYTGYAKEKTYYAFSSPTQKPRKMLAQTIKADGETKVKIQAVIDDPIVHSFDELINNGTIITPPSVGPKPVPLFKVSNLVVIQAGTLTNPQLVLSWTPANNAKRNLIDISYDEGVSWQRVATTTTNSALIDVLFGVVDVRVAPQNDEIGKWFQVQVTIGSDFGTPNQPTGLMLSAPFTGNQVDLEWDEQATAASWFVEVLDLTEAVRYSEVLTTNKFRYRADQAAIHGIGREFDIVVYAINANGVTSPSATLRVKNQQIATLSGVTANGIADQIVIQFPESAEPDFNNFRLYASKTNGFTADASTLIEPNIRTLLYSFPVVYGETWYFRAAGVDVWGTDELNFSSQVSAQSGEIVATVIHDDFIETPMLKANAVTAEKITVPSLSAISAVMGTVTSGIFKTSSLNGYRVEMSSEGDFPIWYGTGSTKDAANGKFYVDKNGNLVAKGIAIYDDEDNLILSAGGTYTGSMLASNIDGLGAFASVDQLNAANITTYIAGAAIPNALMGLASIRTANIDVANVETLTIAGNAVTIPASAYGSAEITLGSSFTTLASVTIQSTGSPISVIASVSLRSFYGGDSEPDSPGVGELRLVCTQTGSVLWSTSFNFGGIRAVSQSPTTTRETITPAARHTRGVGAATYVLQARRVLPSNASYASNRFIQILEVKR
ncbi:host specificity factor TipJ family phage tail protein [Methylophaga sp.]|uniref:host specificity factor TipJ family phage tail protein n=1 Tax=Methylophaga sp. TaxID=2024840 RepID=UPI003A8EAEEB